MRVEYRLEVDPATVILEDMKPFEDQVDITRFENRLDYFKEFARIYAPILADQLIAKCNGAAVTFVCKGHKETLRDENGEPLGHVRCDFEFYAVLPCSTDADNVFIFREGNYLEQEGNIDLKLATDGKVRIIARTEPDEAVKNRPANERLPGDDARLRLVEARFRLGTAGADVSAPAPAVAAPRPRSDRDAHDSGLLQYFFDWKGGYALLMLACVGLGAAHALTPGHGKTLVAAYLVAERGTVWHAIFLGLVTTLTHTGAVLLIAFGLRLFPTANKEYLQSGLGLTMGLLIACLGFYLLLLRLSGRADHVHAGGGHHHHHHHHHAPEPVAARGPLGAWGLVVLGITGGIIPCWDAIGLLVFAVGANYLWLAFPMLLSFSAGLAGVLVLIGILVVKFRNFAGSRWGEGRLVRALPIVSALLVTAMGVWLCYEAVQGS
jgi:ABC-type nickel/cobalt efflux system permease component RcnA